MKLFSLDARLRGLEVFWRALLAAIPTLLALYFLTPLRGVYLYAATVAIGTVALTAWDFFWGRREIARMHYDASFDHWLDQVDAQLRQYGASHTDRSEPDWQIDFEAGFSPHAAARSFLGGAGRTGGSSKEHRKA